MTNMSTQTIFVLSYHGRILLTWFQKQNQLILRLHQFIS